ncbi:hypothetical protein [Mucilaginibacter gilvus]|uniref:Uncharacterized protein n=1 Tax=Mucilaginibacter gilvus TaxID=2305909 RepID=A0A444MMI4_9SPHI|nr:hypothetical protein [Mucilaginibacter gilvus]RWY50877.1 hypothetical protein EPL05_12440 [Mucilaginibacter gilvus]
MKLKLLSGIFAVTAIAFLYTSCKKDAPDFSSTGNSSTVSTKAVSQQIALNLVQSLYGGIGGFSVNDGLSPKINAIAPNRKKIIINSVNPDCGMTMDTTLTYSLDLDTTKVTVSGRFKYATICTNDTPTGLTAYDSLLVSMITPSLEAKYNILQNLTVNVLNAQNPDKLSFNGLMNMQASLQYKTGSKQKLSTSFKYKLTSLIINTANDGDIESGSATFETTGDTPQGKWNYKGSILFLGNHKVKITIDGTTYTVDIQTGQIV